MLSENYLAVRSVRLEGGKTWQPPNDGFFFLFFLEGSGDYSNEKLTRQLQPGDVLVLKQNGKHNRFLAKRAGMTFRWFSLQLEQLYPLFDIVELSLLEDVIEGLGSVKPFQASAGQARECLRLVAEIPLEPSLEQRVQVLGIAARILSREFETVRVGRPGFVGAEEHMDKVFRTLSELDFLNLSVPDLAARFGCSRRHLNRLFHQFFGTSIAEFRMELRLKRVACLLRNPNLKIISVAEQCGFNHLGHFNARFKRRFGVSPGQWRKQLPEGMVKSRRRTGQKGADILKRWINQQDNLEPETSPALDSGQLAANGASSFLREQASC
jgi:AraC-like DNA-binding protein